MFKFKVAWVEECQRVNRFKGWWEGANSKWVLGEGGGGMGIKKVSELTAGFARD